ncbi:MAG: uracil-DNA glycosylase [Saprospiraceae bacterium]|jgi:uracil-DNA glycosylase
MQKLAEAQHVILIGNYAQKYYLKGDMKKNLTETVRHYYDYLPNYFVLPHPSPRNNIWLKKNAWFEEDVIPALKQVVRDVLQER